MKKKVLSAALAAILAVTFMAGCSAGPTTDKVIETANAYGMKKSEDLSSFLTTKNEGVPSYYASEDSTEVNMLYQTLFMHGENGSDAVPESIVVCMEVDAQNKSDYATASGDGVHTYIYAVSAKDNKSAKSIYDMTADLMKANGDKEESKGGYTYILHQSPLPLGATSEDDSAGTGFLGIYVKGKTVIYIDFDIGDNDSSKCAEYFCKELGLVSPLTLKK